MHLSGLFIYPVKSLRGCAVAEAELDALGFCGDRRFLVVDPSGRFLTQRTIPRMALVQPTLNGALMTLRADGAGEMAVPRQGSAAAGDPTLLVTIWQSEGLRAEDCGPEASLWLSEVLQTPSRLVRIGPAFSRPMLERKLPPEWRRPENRTVIRPEGVSHKHFVNFSDGFPALAIGEASLADLNDRLAARGSSPVPMDRFRPNLVIAGSEPFAEDRWRRFRVGDAIFRGGGPCARCVMTTTDQWTGERGIEPLRTLADYRRDPAQPTNVNFGQNLLSESPGGRVRTGDPVEVLEGQA
jgi:MOSC domain-containing protein